MEENFLMSNKKIIQHNDDIIENDAIIDLYSNQPKSKIKRLKNNNDLIEIKNEDIFMEDGKRLLK